jgi:hypothetical protein
MPTTVKVGRTCVKGIILVITPGGDYNYQLFSDPPEDRPEDEHWVTFVFGVIEYADAFGHQRWTKFRSSIGGNLPAGARLFPCEDGNDAN